MKEKIFLKFNQNKIKNFIFLSSSPKPLYHQASEHSKNSLDICFCWFNFLTVLRQQRRSPLPRHYPFTATWTFSFVPSKKKSSHFFSLLNPCSACGCLSYTLTHFLSEFFIFYFYFYLVLCDFKNWVWFIFGVRT